MTIFLDRSQGFERERLELDSWGLLCSASASVDLGNDVVGHGFGKLQLEEDFSIFEHRLGAAVDLPMKFLEGKSCKPFLRVGLEHRGFDLNDQSRALDFENEMFFTLDIIFRFGGGNTPRHHIRNLRRP